MQCRLRDDFIAVDTGKKDFFVGHSGSGPVALPEFKILRKQFCSLEKDLHDEVGSISATPSSSLKKLLTLAFFLEQSDVVAESATIGSAGFKSDTLIAMIDKAPNRLFKCSTRLLKNRLLDEGYSLEEKEKMGDAQAAKMIYETVAENPRRAQPWKDGSAPGFRYRSVRPMDEYGYDCKDARRFMFRLKGYAPSEPGVTMTPSQVLPFTMSMDEYFAEEDRNRWSGAFATDQAYPSFYRRAYIDLCDDIAKAMFDTASRITGRATKKMVGRDQRKVAQRAAQRELRRMFDYMKSRMDLPFVDEDWNDHLGMFAG